MQMAPIIHVIVIYIVCCNNCIYTVYMHIIVFSSESYPFYICTLFVLQQLVVHPILGMEIIYPI